MPLLPPAVTFTFTRRSKLRIVESFQVMNRFIFSEPSVTPVKRPVFDRPVLRDRPPSRRASCRRTTRRSRRCPGLASDRGGRLGMRDGRGGEGALQRIERTAEFARPARSFACASPSSVSACVGIAGQVDQFVGIVLQVVQELVIAVIEVANVLESLVAQAFERGDAIAHGEVLVKRFGSPVVGSLLGDDRLQAAALISLGHFACRPNPETSRAGPDSARSRR